MFVQAINSTLELIASLLKLIGAGLAHILRLDLNERHLLHEQVELESWDVHDVIRVV